MKLHTIATISVIAVAASIIAAAMVIPTFTTSAFALRAVGGDQSQGVAQQANNNGLAGINAGVGVQAEVGGICVNALSTATC
jgi:hypothetical protein